MKVGYKILFTFCAVGLLIIVLIWGYVAFAIDSAVELKRGSIIDELLLRGELRDFPENIAPHSRRYFFSPSDISGKTSNVLILQTSNESGTIFSKCIKWLEHVGYQKNGQGDNSTIEMSDKRGRKALLVSSADEIIITLEN